MQIVIDIPEEEYNTAKFMGFIHRNIIFEAIKNGIVLPKGHGDLKDVAEIKRLWQKGDYDSIVSALLFAPTVIEADREDKE